MVRFAKLLISIPVVFVVSCASGDKIADDEDLRTFVEISSRCAFAERAYSRQEDAFRSEIDDLEFPADWGGLVDTLLARHGAEADFWFEVYSEISARSRSSLPPEEPGDVK
jgi:hypothetical protein